jgi:hypothetical protein
MSGDEKSPPFYESRTFQGTVAVVALVTAILALVGPLKGVISDLFPDGEEPVSWVEVILDTSSAMEEEFDGETKLEAAAGAIQKAVKELDNEGLGLRRTALSCDGKSEQLVPLDSGHTDDVIGEAQNLQPEGDSNIVDAVVGGLEEFKREPIASRGPESRRLLVFTAGVDECSDGNLGEEIRDELEGADISKSSKVELIALGASDEEKAQLEEFETVLKGYAHVELQNPESNEELEGIAEEAGENASSANLDLEEKQADSYEGK